MLMMSEFKYMPSRLEGRAGQPLRLALKNAGSQSHNFSVDGMGGLRSPDVPAGQTVTFEFIPDRPGAYRFFCSQPGHEDAGMMGTLVVR